MWNSYSLQEDLLAVVSDGRKHGDGGDDPQGRDPLRRAVRVLSFLIEAIPNGAGVRDIARAVGMPPSTVHRSLTMLERTGLVSADQGDHRYHIGLEFFRLAWAATSRFPVDRIAIPTMRELAESCDETVVLSLYDDAANGLLFVAAVESTKPLRYVVKLNTWVPIHAGASGLAVLAHLPTEDQERILSGGLAAVTERTLIDPADLRRQFSIVRKHGYAVSKGQRIDGAVGVAVPIWGPLGRVAGALAITMPENRFENELEMPLSRALLDAARRVSDLLGGDSSRSRHPRSGETRDSAPIGSALGVIR